jgi:hypothetical protein
MAQVLPREPPVWTAKCVHRSDARHTRIGSNSGGRHQDRPIGKASGVRRDRLGRGTARSNTMSGRSDVARQLASTRYREDAISSGGYAGPLAVSSRPGRRRHPASSSSRLPLARHEFLREFHRAESLTGRADLAPHHHTPSSPSDVRWVPSGGRALRSNDIQPKMPTRPV